MKSINYLIVELDKAYDNEVKISTGDSLIVNSTIESVEHIKRIATVIESPDFTILKKGDKVIVHHNIFRLRNGIKGEKIESNFFIEENKYFVPLTEVFMYSRDDSDWQAIDPFCFVEPIKRQEKRGFDLNPKEDSYKGNICQHGIMRYPNKELKKQGVKERDIIRFSKNSEYEFIINNKLYYKMCTKDVMVVK